MFHGLDNLFALCPVSMLFINMVVVTVEVSQDLPTVLADVVPARHVSALHVFVDVAALVAPVVALSAGPVRPPEMAHFLPRLVF